MSITIEQIKARRLQIHNLRVRDSLHEGARDRLASWLAARIEAGDDPGELWSEANRACDMMVALDYSWKPPGSGPAVKAIPPVEKVAEVSQDGEFPSVEAWEEAIKGDPDAEGEVVVVEPEPAPPPPPKKTTRRRRRKKRKA